VLPPADDAALSAYVARYLEFFPRDWLAGMRIGVYQHSSVARDVFGTIFAELGAEVTALGRSERFIPVDTEAIRPEDVALAPMGGGWQLRCAGVRRRRRDRPLVADEQGNWLRGDIAGILCARELGAQGVVTPVSSNTALERSQWFQRVLRTRIGSPYVISGMQELAERHYSPVVGYEANGGFLLHSDIEHEGRRLPALPTRDAVIVALCIIGAARRRGVPVSALGAELPERVTYSDRIKDFPTEVSARRLAAFSTGDEDADRRALEAVFASTFGPVAAVDHTDGVRVTFRSGEIAHLRPSGNAPELRAYTEADSDRRAREMNAVCMEILQGWRD
jgi:phosphomannomutase